MTFLSDRMIEGCITSGRIKIAPWIQANLQPASVDLTLGRHFKTIKRQEKSHAGFIDLREPIEYNEYESDIFMLEPYGFALGSTVERLELPHDIIGRLEGKSSLGRIGLTAHVTAGFFDPGFRGNATLELFNANNRSLKIYAGMKVCQISFALLGTPARRPYGHKDLGSKYQNAPPEPEGSKFHENFEGDTDATE